MSCNYALKQSFMDCFEICTFFAIVIFPKMLMACSIKIESHDKKDISSIDTSCKGKITSLITTLTMPYDV